MKKIFLSILITTSALAFSQRYSSDKGFRGTPQQQKEYVNSLTPEQRKDLVRQYRENFMMEDLHISEADKERFGSIYNRYQQEQKQIKDEFNSSFDPEKLSDAEARQKLEQSFITGQKLLDHRRKYAEEMQSVLKPQQVLQMFRNEGKMRDKFRESSENSMRQHPGMRDASARQNSGFRNPVTR